MAKVIFINAQQGKVEEVEVKDVLGDTQALVGGYVQQVPFVRNLSGSNLWVDEEGLCKGYNFGFAMDGHEFSGNGVVSTLSNKHTKMTLEQVSKRVQF
jgi:hypothetical protein